MIRRELAVFLVVGGLTVLVDFTAYRLLLAASLATGAAKATSFLAGSVFAYFANRAWTFDDRGRAGASAARFGLLYAGTLGANVLVNAAALRLAGSAPMTIDAAFVLATGVSASLNFLGMKWFVFRDRRVEGAR